MAQRGTSTAAVHDPRGSASGIAGAIVNTSTRTRLFASFGIVMALLVLVLAVATVGGARVSRHTDDLAAALPRTELGAGLRDAAGSLEAAQDAYVTAIVRGAAGAASDDAPARREFLTAAARFRAALGTLRADTGLSEDEVAALSSVAKGLDRFMALDARMWPLYRSEDPADRARADALMDEADAVIGGMDGAIDRLVGAIHDDGARAAAAASDAASRSRFLILLLGVIALILGGVQAALITRSIVRPLVRLREVADRAAEGDLTVQVANGRADEVGQVSRAFDHMLRNFRELVGRVSDAARAQTRSAREMADASEQSRQAAGQIAATVEEIASGAADQAEGAQRVTGTVEEMVQGVSRVAAGGNAAARAAEEAGEVAGRGAEVVDEATAAMDRISDQVDDASVVVSGLGAKGQAIGEIVGTIDQIASQTNLLALNAAIEAARAGEQGRGFAVVAEEVRKLAEESQKAAASIGEIIREIQQETGRAVDAMRAGRSEVATGVHSVARAGEAFASIREQVERVSGEVGHVAAAAQELEAGAGEVQEQVASVAAVSEENAAAAEEVAAATQQGSASAEEVSATAARLASDAEGLAALVTRFTV
ncbi:MAG: methyl-accepting chemotaxis protein [Actinomycetota bacterium]